MNRRPYLPIALVSLAGLALEIGLTRLFSALFFPPAVFAILSLAILGIGLGAALVTWRRGWRDPRFVAPYLAGAALSVVGIVVAATLPALQTSLFVLVALPYLFIGAGLTVLFDADPQDSPRLYLADLLGAGVGALLAIPLLNTLGGLNGVLATAPLLALAAWLLARRPPLAVETVSTNPASVARAAQAGQSRSRRASLAVAALPAALLLLVAANSRLAWLGIDMRRLAAEKPIASALAAGGATGEIVATRWDAFARSDLVQPADGGPYRIYMDGAAGSVMPPVEDNEFLWRDIGLFPFATEQPQRVFLIGPGAGLDVWFALQGGAEEILGVEVNPASVALAREYAAYNGDLYGRPQVSIQIDDGRSLLQRQASRYDLIFLSQLLTLAAERSGYALVENSAYTVEAFQTFLQHLAPEGQIGIKLYDEPTLTRALSTALAAFRAEGLSDQEGLQHVIALLDSSADPPIPLLLVARQPYSREDALSLGAVAQQVGFDPLFLPGVVEQPPLDRVAAGAIPFSDVVAAAENDLSPATDDRPFFFQFERGIPRSLRPLVWGALALTLAGGLLAALYQRRALRQALAAGECDRSEQRARLAATPIYFAALGLGFILLEIGVIQQTRIFLGHPTTAITLSLATLLIAGGLGSGLSGRLFGRSRRSGLLETRPLLAVILLVFLWLLAWPVLGYQFAGATPPVRMLLVVLALAPLGLAMGMPFPLGLQTVAAWGREQVPLAWTVNGVMSVVGSVLAVTIAIRLGYTNVLLAGASAYGLATAAALLPRLRAPRSTSEPVKR